MNPGYRPDIDGLRAVAVLSVLAFHAFPDALPGGFVGVDIFFVISGFLISGIILAEIDAGAFTVRRFYARRIRRIFPALSLLLAAVLGFGWLAAAPFEFRQLGWHALFSAGFGENLWLWTLAGDYFDEGSASKPLLHLWSLGVEEQYYLLWPLLLMLLRRRPVMVGWLIGIVAVLSFAANILTVQDSARVAFYWPHTRFWELMIGSSLAYVQFRRHRLVEGTAGRFASFAGCGLLLAALLLISESRRFPGWWALLPTLGAALLIACPRGWINRAVLSRRPLVYIGLVSYPLYLWHWPLLVYSRLVFDAEARVLQRLLVLALSGVLAVLTYEAVEKPLRRSPRVVAPLAGTMAALAAAGVLASTALLPPRSSAVPGVAEVTEAFDDWGWTTPPTRRGDSTDAVVLIGDSHMQQFLPRLDHLVQDRSKRLRTIIIRTKGGCAPIRGLDRQSSACAGYVAESYRMAREAHVKTVVIAASWPGFLTRTDYYRSDDPSHTPIDLSRADWVWNTLESDLRQLTLAGKQVVLFLASPRGDSLDPRTLAVRKGIDFETRPPQPISRTALLAETAAADAHIDRIAARIGATLVDPVQALCSERECSPVDARGMPLYKDQSHIRASVARERVTLLDQFVLAAPLRADLDR